MKRTNLFSGTFRSSSSSLYFSILASVVTATTTAGIPTSVHSFISRSPRRALSRFSSSRPRGRPSPPSSSVMYVYRGPSCSGLPQATRVEACCVVMSPER